jgi:hypothetical protein
VRLPPLPPTVYGGRGLIGCGSWGGAGAVGALPACLHSGGDTPLHLAAWRGHADAVKLLLRPGGGGGGARSVVDATDAKGDAPLHLGAHGGHSAVVRHLLEVIQHVPWLRERCRNGRQGDEAHCGW